MGDSCDGWIDRWVEEIIDGYMGGLIYRMMMIDMIDDEENDRYDRAHLR